MSTPTVISFGCPRSGTTFMLHCLQALEPAATVLKLTESNRLHPAQRRLGLWDLARLYRGRPLVFVRTVRHPHDIAESFLAARTPELRGKMPGIARNSDGDIAHWIREESTSVMVQRPTLAEEPHVMLLEVRYESLDNDHAREGLIADLRKAPLEDQEALEGVLARLREFGQAAVRPGRLSKGMGIVSTPEEREYFRTRLRAVTRREGYEG